MPDNRFDNGQILSTTALTTNATTSVVRPVNVDNIGLQVIWSAGSGSPAGTVAVNASNDGVNYTTLTLSSVPAISGNSGTLLIDINQFPFTYLTATITMSAGSITAVVKATGVQL